VREGEELFRELQKCLLDLAMVMREVEEVLKLSLFWADRHALGG